MARTFLRVLVLVLPAAAFILLGADFFGVNLPFATNEIFSVFALYGLGVLFVFFPDVVGRFNRDEQGADTKALIRDAEADRSASTYDMIHRIIGVGAMIVATLVLIGVFRR